MARAAALFAEADAEAQAGQETLPTGASWPALAVVGGRGPQACMRLRIMAACHIPFAKRKRLHTNASSAARRSHAGDAQRAADTLGGAGGSGLGGPPRWVISWPA